MLKKNVLVVFLLLVLSVRMNAEVCVPLTINETPGACDTLNRRILFPVEGNVDTNEMRALAIFLPEEVSLYIDSVVCAKGGIINLPDSFFYGAHRVEVGFPEMSDTYSLVLTTLPVVVLDFLGVEPQDDQKITGLLTLLDPIARTNGIDKKVEQRCMAKIRGASSKGYPKKSLSLELCDELNEEKDIRLLGYRSDGDWILDAAYIDPSRFRNRLAMDIWNKISSVPYASEEPDAVNGTRGEFVEVIKNGKYEGLFCLSEKIDRKQLKVKKNETSGGAIFKGTDWSNAVQLKYYNSLPEYGSLSWEGWEAKYPSTEGAAHWDELRELIDFSSLETNPSEEGFFFEAKQKIYMDNLVDYTLFYNLIVAIDNTMKNTYISYRSATDKRWFITPWDLDLSFGPHYGGYYAQVAYPFSNYLNKSMLLARLEYYDAEDFFSLLASRWRELSPFACSIDSVAQDIDRYYGLLTTSGAYGREKERWSGEIDNYDSEAEYIKDWYAKSFFEMERVLDEYVGIHGTPSAALAMNITGRKINLSFPDSRKRKVLIFNSAGALIASSLVEGRNHSISSIQSGVYIVRVEADGTSFSRRIVLT